MAPTWGAEERALCAEVQRTIKEDRLELLEGPGWKLYARLLDLLMSGTATLQVQALK